MSAAEAAPVSTMFPKAYTTENPIIVLNRKKKIYMYLLIISHVMAGKCW